MKTIYVVEIRFSSGSREPRAYFTEEKDAIKDAERRGSRGPSYSHFGYCHEVETVDVYESFEESQPTEPNQ